MKCPRDDYACCMCCGLLFDRPLRYYHVIRRCFECRMLCHPRDTTCRVLKPYEKAAIEVLYGSS